LTGAYIADKTALTNIGTHLKHNKYFFDIPIPFCHNLYLSATLKQFLAEFAARYHPPFSNTMTCIETEFLKKPGAPNEPVIAHLDQNCFQ
jgi:hypothetical protein